MECAPTDAFPYAAENLVVENVEVKEEVERVLDPRYDEVWSR